MTDTDSDKKPAKDDPIATAILKALSDGGVWSFEKVAKQIAEARRRPKDGPQLWRKYLQAVKQQAVHLARQGRIEIVRKGQVADPNDFKGIVKLRLPKP